MIKEKRQVKAEGKVIGEVEVFIYESFSEADSHLGKDEGGKSIALKLLNRQAIIRVMDDFRNSLETGGLTMKAIKAKVAADPALIAKIKALIGEV